MGYNFKIQFKLNPLPVITEASTQFHPLDLFSDLSILLRNTWVVELGWHSARAEAGTRIPSVI